MSFYKTCPHCGANLDSDEQCDCIPSMYARLSPENRTKIDAFVHSLVQKERAAQGATNTQDGEAEQIKPAVSVSNDTTV